jgi:hypothetical protein
MIDSLYHYEIYETALYAEGNYVAGYPAVTEDNWSGGIDFSEGATEQDHRAHVPFDFPSIAGQTAEEAYPLVVADAGASIVRDVIDQRIANEVLTGTTTYKGSKTGDPGIIDSQEDVGGWPELNTLPAPTDTDQDGMPDQWETGNGLNPNDPEDRNDDRNEDGYTNLEEYLDAVIFLTPVNVMYRSKKPLVLHCYPNPTNSGFSIDLSSIGNGTVEILNLLGQSVYYRVSTEPVLQVYDHDLRPGIYIITVTDIQRNVYKQKLVIN